jgi:hypothetical protein
MASPWFAAAPESEIAPTSSSSASTERTAEIAEAGGRLTPPPTDTILRSQEEVLLVMGAEDSIATDYAAYVRSRKDRLIRVFMNESAAVSGRTAAEQSVGSVCSIVIFLQPRLTRNDRRILEQIIDRCRGVRFVALISTFRVHLGDRHAAKIENYVLDQLRPLGARVVVFRPGHNLSCHSRTSKCLRRLGFCHPLLPRRWRSCFVKGEELFVAIEKERQSNLLWPTRVYTLLGSNLSWKDILARQRTPGIVQTSLKAICFLLSLLQLAQLAGLVFALLARLWPSLRQWNFDTLRPQSLQELLSLYNKYNYQHLKVVGYNNGVIHFGHRYPGKTVVSTVFCNRIRRTSPEVIKADCGATVRHALDFLAEADQELPVVPNYSYVCLGTSFFIPIHGSASNCSTIADTITRAIWYDPVHDQFIAASRADPEFRELIYNLEADVLLLRLYLRVKHRSPYYLHRQELISPSGQQLVAALQDCRASNVEIRQASASHNTVTISKYYTTPGASNSPVMELPRDALGRLWDRLEENAMTSFLMHALTRYFAWHVELFFTPEEFLKFWESHGDLPLRKIQLRYIRRDSFPHSTFRHHDCVSVDLFMLRWRRHRVENYLTENFGVVQTNPGKHSR